MGQSDRTLGGHFARVWPADVVHALFFLMQMVLWFGVRGEVEHFGWWLAFDVLGLLLLLPLIRISGSRPVRDGLLRLGYGLMVVPLIFTQVGLTLVASNPPDQAAHLAAFDRWMFFGNDPIEALEAVSAPWLTELMQWAYTAYLLLPAGAIILLVWKGTPNMVARSAFSLVTVFYLSYVGYYLVPASGPNINNNFGPLLPCHVDPQPLYAFKTELPGLWLADALREWMFRAELTKFDCFPSGHVAVAIACATYASRIGKRVGVAFWILASGVILSTMYLRYHYVIDVIVGAALGLFGVTVLELLTMGPAEKTSRRDP